MIQDIKDRIPTKVLSNGAIRYGVYDENNNLLRYEYIKREDEPLEEGTNINRALFKNLQGDLYTNDRYSLITPTVSEETDLITPQESIKYMWENESLTKAYCISKDVIFNCAIIETNSTYSGSYLPASPLQSATWRSKSSSEEKWWKITFWEPIQIKRITLSGSAGWVLQGHNDTTIDEWTNLAEYTSDVTTYELQNQDKYSEYRVYWASSSGYKDLGKFIIESLYAPRYILESNIPLSSYEEGKKANIQLLPITDTITDYVEEEFTSPIQPYFTSNNDVENDYGLWEIMGGSNFTGVWKAFDSSTSTYAQSESLGANVQTFLQIGNGGNYGKKTWAIKPRGIEITYARATVEGIAGFDYKEKRWVLLTDKTGSTEASQSTISYSFPNEERYFTAFRVILTRDSSSYTTPYIYNFKITSGYIRYGTVVPHESDVFTNAYLKIGALQPQKINAILHSGINYQLVYKSGKWEKDENSTLIEKRQLMSNYIEELKGSAKYVIIKPIKGTGTYIVFPGDESLSLSSSNYKISLSNDGTCIIYSYTSIDLDNWVCLIFY